MVPDGCLTHTVEFQNGAEHGSDRTSDPWPCLDEQEMALSSKARGALVIFSAYGLSFCSQVQHKWPCDAMARQGYPCVFPVVIIRLWVSHVWYSLAGCRSAYRSPVPNSERWPRCILQQKRTIRGRMEKKANTGLRARLRQQRERVRNLGLSDRCPERSFVRLSASKIVCCDCVAAGSVRLGSGIGSTIPHLRVASALIMRSNAKGSLRGIHCLRTVHHGD